MCWGRQTFRQDRKTADAETSAARLRQHRRLRVAAKSSSLESCEAFESYEALETSISSRSALASSMRFTKRLLSCVTHRLGQGDAGLNEHHDAHREVSLDQRSTGRK